MAVPKAEKKAAKMVVDWVGKKVVQMAVDWAEMMAA